MSAIHIQNVTKSFGAIRVLRGIDLDVRDGEFLSLVGPSGCGKSTLLRIVAGLESQDQGEVRIGDRVVDDLAPGQRDIAMVFQSYALYPHLSVYDNIAVPLRVRRLSRWQRLPLIGPRWPGSRAARAAIDVEVRAAAQMLDISHLLARRPAQLSGGQRQRTALGRAIVRHPQAFLMDEPLSNLDANLRLQMRSELTALHRSLGSTFVYVTHDQTEAMTMSTRLAVMLDGDLLQVDSPERVYSDPRSLRVAEFFGNLRLNTLSCDVDQEGLVRYGGVLMPVRVSRDRLPIDAVVLGLRPESLRLVAPEQGVLGATVTGHEHLGSDVVVRLRLCHGGDIEWQSRCDPLVGQPAAGARVGLRFDAARALLFDAAGVRVPGEDLHRA